MSNSTHKKMKQIYRIKNFAGKILKGHAVALVLLFAIGIQMQQAYQQNGSLQVLGFATNISPGDLLAITNQNRANNGLGALQLNAQLSTAAQNKANHMIANNYWAHFAPDGTSPWFFVNNAGYAYQKAGENLAYGYATSAAVMIGWMNSPSHAANILDGDYQEVGFATANGASFQGGENTVVVALYGQPSSFTPPVVPEPEPTPVTAPTQPQTPQQQTQNPTPQQQTNEVALTADSAAEEVIEVTEVQEEATNEEARQIESQYTLNRLGDEAEIGGVNGIPPAPSSNTITNLEIILSGDAPTSMYVTTGLLLLLTGVYIIRHTKAIYQVVVHGEHFIVGHPLLEASIVYAALWLMLVGTYGVIL